MWAVSFEQHSLLFGESCLWFFIFWTCGFKLWPDFEHTKSAHLFKLTKWGQVFLRYVIILKSVKIVEKVGLWLTNTIQPIYYSVIVFKFGPTVGESFLKFLNKTNHEELGYKVLYAIPVAARFVNLSQLVFALYYTSIAPYEAWIAYDHFDMFSIPPKEQFKIMALSMLALFPDFLRSMLDILFILGFLHSDPSQPEITRTAFFSLLNLAAASTTFVFRYKPVINIIYAEICVQRHLKRLYRHLQESYDRHPNNSSVLASSDAFRMETGSALKKFDLLGVNRAALQVGAPPSSDIPSRPFKPYSANASSARSPFRTRRSPANRLGDSAKLEMHSSKVEIQSELFTFSQNQKSVMSGNDPSIEIESTGSRCTIHHLFELEKHLTQLYLFVTALDRQSPFIVYSVIVTNIMLVFHTGLFVREVPLRELNWFYALIFCVAPAVPLLVLFSVGSLIERECKQITVLVERVYFEDPHQMLLYKQMKNSQYSLLRIFKLLESTKFSCDELIDMNLETMKNLSFYILSGIFIVIQYDLLLTINEESGEHVATRRDGSGLLWNNERHTNSSILPSLFG